MPDAAWNDELLRDPHGVADKRSRVQQMFAAIAPKYDLNNRVHSFGMDQRWRKKAVKLANLNVAERIVDVACGTGDLTIALGREACWLAGRERPRWATWDKATVLGIDLTFQMLPIAREKDIAPWVKHWEKHPDEVDKEFSLESDIGWLNADATALPLADASADVVSIAFGVRNVKEPHLAIAEFFRILRPGGRVIVLEFSQPENRVVRFLNDLYCKRIMPHTATWLSGDTSGAYKYLPMSVATFMNREAMMAMLRDAGFVDVTQHPMTFGVAVVYRGYKR